MYKIYFLTVALVIMLFACHNSSDPTEQENPYDIYSLIIDSNYAHHDQIVIKLITDRFNLTTSEPELSYLRETMKTLTDETYNAFVLQNNKFDTLHNNFKVDAEVILVTDAEIREIFNYEKGWDKFYQIYPKSQGLLSFSKIGYNAANTQALVYYGNIMYYLAGAGYFELYEKVNGKWKYIARSNTWIS